MFQLHATPTTAVPYLWECVAIDGAPEKPARRVRFHCPMGTMEFWTDQGDLLRTLKVGDYYRFGVTLAYSVAATS